LVIPDIIAFTISGITDIIAISDMSTFTIGGQKIEEKCTPKIFSIKHTKNAKKCTQKIQKKMKKTHRNCNNHTKIAKNDISGIADILPGFSPYWLSPITSFHHIGDNRYYRDILESVTSLTHHRPDRVGRVIAQVVRALRVAAPPECSSRLHLPLPNCAALLLNPPNRAAATTCALSAITSAVERPRPERAS
jgi:hypothetical protein